MLRIYDVMLEVLRAARAAIAQIEKHDSDLARQMKRAGASVALNLAEGSGSCGGIRRARYRSALGSAREVMACLQSAEALGYIDGIDARIIAGLRHVIHVLVHIVA